MLKITRTHFFWAMLPRVYMCACVCVCHFVWVLFHFAALTLYSCSLKRDIEKKLSYFICSFCMNVCLISAWFFLLLQLSPTTRLLGPFFFSIVLPHFFLVAFFTSFSVNSRVFRPDMNVRVWCVFFLILSYFMYFFAIPLMATSSDKKHIKNMILLNAKHFFSSQKRRNAVPNHTFTSIYFINVINSSPSSSAFFVLLGPHPHFCSFLSRLCVYVLVLSLSLSRTRCCPAPFFVLV